MGSGLAFYDSCPTAIGNWKTWETELSEAQWSSARRPHAALASTPDGFGEKSFPSSPSLPPSLTCFSAVVVRASVVCAAKLQHSASLPPSHPPHHLCAPCDAV